MSGALAGALDQACVAFAHRSAVQDREERLTYQALSARAQAVADALSAAHAAADEPVVVLVGNRAADFAAFLGAWRAGCVVVPSHRSAPAPVLDGLIARCGARFLVDCGADAVWPVNSAAVSGSASVRSVSDVAPPSRELLRDAAFIIFTSGSTGQPKGAVVSHRAIAGKLAANDSYLHFDTDTRALLALQITFSFGIWVSLLTLTRGGTLFALDKFDAASAFEAICEHRIDRVAVVPTMLRAMLALVEREPERGRQLAGSGLPRQLLTGGESLGAALSARTQALFADAELIDIYGLTETATSDFVLKGEDLERFSGCIGRAAPGVQYRIAAADDSIAGHGATGELQILTPFAMNGYLDAPELTCGAFADGYFRTGDLARERAPGVLELVGRAKEIISRGGNKVAPLEIEQLLLQHPEVAQALVTGVPDALLGERIHALIVARGGVQPSAQSLRDWAAQRIEKYKLPDAFHFSAELPLGRTGKVDRGGLRAMIVSGAFEGGG